ncbi:MAG: T9SS type A sorting domain-containing protein, partial [Sphingobacteriaceae bacterium]
KALSSGIQVPYFFSGLHHGFDPGSPVNLDDPKRPNPWITNEVYCRWFSVYGGTPENDYGYSRKTWNIIAHGGNAYAHYMAFGGTNFDYNNSDADAASYDYGAPVGETGDIRPMYYQFKRAGLFARSFGDILQNSTDATPSVQGVLSNTTLKATARQSPAGAILFLDNPTNSAQKTKLVYKGQSLPSNGTFNLQPQDIVPVIYNFQLTPNVKIEYSAAKIFGISKQGNTTTLVAYGEPNDAGQFQFSSANQFQLTEGALAFSISGTKALLSYTCPDTQPATYTFKCGAETIRVLVLSRKLADRTWFTDVKGTNVVLVGPEYVAGLTLSGGVIQLKTENAWTPAIQYPIWVYGDNLKITGPVTPAKGNHTSNFPLNGTWQVKNASGQSGIHFDDSKWAISDTAQLMGADGDLSNSAWYRTPLNIKQAGTYSLSVKKGGGRAIVFIDSLRVASGKIKESLQFQLSAGNHTLAVFTAHDGRNHLPLYIGDLSVADPKGLGGYIDLLNLNSTAPKTITDWKIIKASSQSDINAIPSAGAFAAAPAYIIGSNPFNLFATSYAWFGAVIPAGTANIPTALYLESLDDVGTIFINGKKVATSISYQTPVTISLEGLIDPSKTNFITIFIKNASGPGGIAKPVNILYNTIKGWRMAGGPGDHASVAGYSTLTATSGFGRPAFYKNSFSANLADTVSAPMYRVVTTGLGHGNIWVNGHNLGRYPQIIAINGLYIPECWLVNGQNSVVIYDEDGNLPTKVTIQAEVAASRDVTTIKYRLPAKIVTSVLPDKTAAKLSAVISPNPAKDMAKVNFENVDGEVSAQLLDIYGNTLWQSQKGNFTFLQVPVSNLKGGVYIIVVKDNSATQTLKLLKEQ